LQIWGDNKVSKRYAYRIRTQNWHTYWTHNPISWSQNPSKVKDNVSTINMCRSQFIQTHENYYSITLETIISTFQMNCTEYWSTRCSHHVFIPKPIIPFYSMVVWHQNQEPNTLNARIFQKYFHNFDVSNLINQWLIVKHCNNKWLVVKCD